MGETVLVCEDSQEGIFTAIYEAYRLKLALSDVYIQAGEEDIRLFAVYQNIQTDFGKAVKVMRTLRERFGEEDFRSICFAVAADAPGKAQAVFRTVADGLKSAGAGAGGGKGCNGRRGSLLDNLADDSVRRVMELCRRTTNELHHLKEFLRFQELEEGILYAKIGPRDNILAFLTPHFADRLPMENFMIYDDVRNLLALHPAGKEWYLASGEAVSFEESAGELSFTEEEYAYQELFEHFCHKISIKERTNYNLQRGMLPLRFRKYMVEFQ